MEFWVLQGDKLATVTKVWANSVEQVRYAFPLAQSILEISPQKKVEIDYRVRMEVRTFWSDNPHTWIIEWAEEALTPLRCPQTALAQLETCFPSMSREFLLAAIIIAGWNSLEVYENRYDRVYRLK